LFTAAAAADAPAKKTKKVDPKPSEPANDAPKPALKKKKSDAAVDKSAKSKDNGEPTRQIKPRKRAADFLSDDEDSEADAGADVEVKAPQEKPSKKKSKKEDGAASKEQKPKPAGDKKPKSISKPSKAETKAGDSDEDAASGASTSDEDGEDDQTTALIKGFESSGDEDASGDEGFDASKPLPKVPDSKKAKRKIQKKQKESGEPEEPGTVYIG
jgi:nucleolar protein 15